MNGLRNRPGISIALGIILAVASGVLVFIIIQSQAPTVPVVVAVRNIGIGEEVSSENIDVQNFPAAMVPGNTYQDKGQVTGQNVVYGPIIKGAMIYTDNISSDGALQSALFTYAPVLNLKEKRPELEPGTWSAIEIPAENGIRGLQKGDFVDIYGERPLAPDSIDVAIIVPHALIIETPTEKYPKYTVAVEQQYLESAAEITVRKMNVVLALSSAQPKINW